MKEKLIQQALFFLALSALLSLLLIAIFIFYEGVPLIVRVGWKDFLASATWAPTKGKFGKKQRAG